MNETHDPVAILRRFHDATNALDYVALETMFTPDAVYVSAGVGGAVEGREAIMAAFRAYFDEYPDQVAEDISLDALSPVSARSFWRLEGTSTRTGKWRERHGAETITVDDRGRIVRVDVEG